MGLSTRPRSHDLPSSPGTYILILEASVPGRVRVGALGTLKLDPGFYAYVGSARGPGGLAARLSHHYRRARSPHWHIDYLRRRTSLHEIWLAEGVVEREHRWAKALEGDPLAMLPLPGFGASDCRCRTHLFRFSHLPPVSAFRRRLISAEPAAGLVPWPKVVRRIVE